MKSVPLKLSSYFFPEIHVLADPSYKQSKDLSYPFTPEELNCSIGASCDDEMLNFSLRLSISVQNEDHKYPYSFVIDIVGLIQLLDEKLDKEKRFEYCVDNGLSLLYSSAREHLLSITSRAPHGPVCLPVVTFLGEAAGLRESTENDCSVTESESD